jgi:hypothetical protein
MPASRPQNVPLPVVQPSHSYTFQAADLARVFVGPLLVVLAFALILRLGARQNLLPAPKPFLDADQTILASKVLPSELATPAQVVLIGDSSCLMDVSALQLQNQLARPVLNLGTLSYLDLGSFGRILTNYFRHAGSNPVVVVLLMHPEALRRPAASDYHVALLDSLLGGLDFSPPDQAPVGSWVGVDIFRGRILSRVQPMPLTGGYARRYGFTWDLADHLARNLGSAIDPGRFDPKAYRGSTEYRLAAALESHSRAFRSAVPAKIRLVVGITPIPASLVSTAFEETHRALLDRWISWMQPASGLFELPATFPDEQFASATHLDSRGVETFTTLLAKSLAPHSK